MPAILAFQESGLEHAPQISKKINELRSSGQRLNVLTVFSNCRYARGMRKKILLLSLLLAANVQAAPTGSEDAMSGFLVDKGLMSKIDQVRQSVEEKASDLVVTALGFLGVPYHRGGNTAESGFDCSGFVKAMYEQTIGLILPRRAEQQAAATQKIEKNELQPGDLVFFNTMKRAFSHVGIYVGEGKFIHSPKPGAEVRVESMNINYWKQRFDGARRVPSASATAPNPN
jgi:cell wall-associated NlpC family hydrolase